MALRFLCASLDFWGLEARARIWGFRERILVADTNRTEAVWG